jgi:hypothetical protein
MVVASGTSDWVRIMEIGTAYKPAVETWVHPLWPAIGGAVWISSNYTVEDPAVDSWRAFLRMFYVPGSVVSASINITTDNAYILYVNGELIGSDGNVYGPPPSPRNGEYASIEEYDLTSILEEGINWIWIVLRNYEPLTTATWQSNPTGLIYRLRVTYKVPCYS